ncbi:hypothetical protein EV356DRAFT_250630 [Viridothelium virens]|uniref:Uncharacterized protein n=1 Tax=Viridothelium virens TaxID=1048519 RepID=A0A6A6H2Z1_VIRVR|nr:hypothetical protein EV356DRAFT_250630 [Viridothelium virens]
MALASHRLARMHRSRVTGKLGSCRSTSNSCLASHYRACSAMALAQLLYYLTEAGRCNERSTKTWKSSPPSYSCGAHCTTSFVVMEHPPAHF